VLIESVRFNLFARQSGRYEDVVQRTAISRVEPIIFDSLLLYKYSYVYTENPIRITTARVYRNIAQPAEEGNQQGELNAKVTGRNGYALPVFTVVASALNRRPWWAQYVQCPVRPCALAG
jgi:hypothetical protein